MLDIKYRTDRLKKLLQEATRATAMAMTTATIRAKDILTNKQQLNIINELTRKKVHYIWPPAF